MKSDWNMMIDIKGISDNVIEAGKTPAGWFSALMLYLAPLHNIYSLMLTIVIADFITGMFASKKRHIPYSSSRLKNSIVKLFCYFGSVYIFWQIEERLEIEWLELGFYKFVAGFIAVVEAISILENMAIITEKPIFLKIIRIVRGKASEKGGTLIEDLLKEKSDDTPKPKKN